MKIFGTIVLVISFVTMCTSAYLGDVLMTIFAACAAFVNSLLVASTVEVEVAERNKKEDW